VVSRRAELLELAPLARRGRASRFKSVNGAWTGLDGYFAGERLSLEPSRNSFEVATFVFTRVPYESDAIPGGVDPEGWAPR
jgi:hypothetical protein